MNLTNEILIHKSGKVLDAAIRSALKKVSNAYLAETGQIGADLYDITTKTNVEACFAKFSILGVLKSDDLLNEDYIFLAMELYRVGIENWTESGIEQFFYTSIDVALKYKKSYGRRLRPGIGTFLVALHVQKIITLPSAFDWPANRKERSTSHRVLKHITAGSELIKLFASLARSEITKDAGSPFEYIVHSEKRFDWFRTYGMKLLLATGWLAPEDANEAELKEIQKTLPVKGIGKQVTLVLLHAFKDRCRLNIHSVRAISQKGPYLDLSLAPRVADPDKSADDVFALLTEIIKTSFARPDRFEKLDTVFRTETQWSNWIELQQAYIKRQRYETPKGPMAALAAFNLYMFFYLPKWFQENPETKLQFPDTPDKLIGGVYISRVIEPKEAVPRTFIEFLDERAKKLNQSDNAHYAQARNVQSFFNFITERSSELPNCSAFKQPIGKLDLPKTSGSIGTNKRPLPRRIFRHFVNYIECVRAYINVVIEKVVSYDAVDAHSYLLAHEIENRDLPWIDTFALASRVGFVPVMFTKNRTVPLRYLNYFSTCEWL